MKLMNFKALAIYFIALTSALVFLLGFFTWHGSDVEFQHYAAIRMHACDIVKNDRSTLREFNPAKCEVRRRHFWVGQIIDVSCIASNIDHKTHRFAYSYSDVHMVFNYYFKKYLVAQRGGHCGD